MIASKPPSCTQTEPNFNDSLKKPPLQHLSHPCGRALLSSNDSRALGRLRGHVSCAQLSHRIRILLCLVCCRISVPIAISISIATSPRGTGLLRGGSPSRLRISGPLVTGGCAGCLGFSRLARRTGLGAAGAGLCLALSLLLSLAPGSARGRGLSGASGCCCWVERDAQGRLELRKDRLCLRASCYGAGFFFFKFLSALICILQAELAWMNVPTPASSRAFANSAFWAARIPYSFAYQYEKEFINLDGIITFAPSLAAGLACLLKTPARPAGVAATSELDAARKNKAMLV